MMGFVLRAPTTTAWLNWLLCNTVTRRKTIELASRIDDLDADHFVVYDRSEYVRVVLTW